MLGNELDLKGDKRTYRLNKVLARDAASRMNNIAARKGNFDPLLTRACWYCRKYRQHGTQLVKPATHFPKSGRCIQKLMKQCAPGIARMERLTSTGLDLIQHDFVLQTYNPSSVSQPENHRHLEPEEYPYRHGDLNIEITGIGAHKVISFLYCMLSFKLSNLRSISLLSRD